MKETKFLIYTKIPTCFLCNRKTVKKLIHSSDVNYLEKLEGKSKSPSPHTHTHHHHHHPLNALM